MPAGVFPDPVTREWSSAPSSHQSVQSATSDARAEKEFSDTEFIMDQVNEHTDGGLKLLLDRLEAIEARLPPVTTP
jgi:hypothetical protein